MGAPAALSEGGSGQAGRDARASGWHKGAGGGPMTTDAAGMKAAIARHGDTFTVGGNNRKGIFEVLPADRALDYLTQAQIDAATKPLRLAHVAHDDATAVNDTVTW